MSRPRNPWREGHARRVDIATEERLRREIMIAIGERIATQLRKADIAHAELAAALGVHRSAVVKWAGGRELPSLHRLCTIAAAIPCSLSDLLPTDLCRPEPTV